MGRFESEIRGILKLRYLVVMDVFFEKINKDIGTLRNLDIRIFGV